MLFIKSVKEGDVIYPVTVSGGTLGVMARLPVKKIEPAYGYLIQELREPLLGADTG